MTVSRAPAPASASATAAPMPRPPPVTTACRPSRLLAIGLGSFLQLRRAREVALELVAAGEILLRPRHVAVAELRGGVQRPVRVGEMRTGERAQVGAARRR